MMMSSGGGGGGGGGGSRDRDRDVVAAVNSSTSSRSTIISSSSPSIFTPHQWQELEHQALFYKYLVSGVPIPPDLVSFVARTQLDLDFSSSRLFPTAASPTHQSALGWGSFQTGYGNIKRSSSSSQDPEPGRCRRTDGKKWRCSKEAHSDSKYCEKHMHRGKNRSSSKNNRQQQQPTLITLASPSPFSSSNSSSSPHHPLLSSNYSYNYTSLPTISDYTNMNIPFNQGHYNNTTTDQLGGGPSSSTTAAAAAYYPFLATTNYNNQVSDSQAAGRSEIGGVAPDLFLGSYASRDLQLQDNKNSSRYWGNTGGGTKEETDDVVGSGEEKIFFPESASRSTSTVRLGVGGTTITTTTGAPDDHDAAAAQYGSRCFRYGSSNIVDSEHEYKRGADENFSNTNINVEIENLNDNDNNNKNALHHFFGEWPAAVVINNNNNASGSGSSSTQLSISMPPHSFS